MARTKINPYVIAGAYNDADGVEVAFTACDQVNGNYARLSGGEVLVARGTGAITIKSVPDALGRLGDLTRTLTGTEHAVYFGPFPVAGFGQVDGSLYFNGVSTVSVAILSPSR